MFQLGEELATEYQKEQRLGKGPAKTITTDSCDQKKCEIIFCKGNKTNKICLKCEKHVCGKCTAKNVIICKKCGETK